MKYRLFPLRDQAESIAALRVVGSKGRGNRNEDLAIEYAELQPSSFP